MMPPEAVLDTDILSAILQRDRRVLANTQTYFAAHGRFTFSIITRFEMLRGLKARDAKSLLSRFEQICVMNQVLALTDDIVEQGADIYADLHRRGALISDADILIAATALVH